MQLFVMVTESVGHAEPERTRIVPAETSFDAEQKLRQSGEFPVEGYKIHVKEILPKFSENSFGLPVISR